MSEKLLEKIFSVKNDKDRKHKVVNMLGVKVKIKNPKYQDFEEKNTAIKEYETDTISDLQDGFLRVRLNHTCNCKCEFCVQEEWSQEVQNAIMPKEWLYNYLVPLYSRVKIVQLTGGEITCRKENFEFYKYLAENFPQATVLLESNAISFDEKWQDLSVKNLGYQHFSLNTSNAQTYKNGVWEQGGEAVYNKIIGNIKSCCKKWEDAGLSVFKPSVSMVVTHKTADDVYDFIKLSLELGLRGCIFYFAIHEGAGKDDFTYPEILGPKLKMLMEIEKVLANKFPLIFRLRLPLLITQQYQKEVNDTPIEELNAKYSELIELAKDRNIMEEWKLRNEARKSHGKKTFTFDEEYKTCTHTEDFLLTDGTVKNVCFAPFKELDIMADGTMLVCGWTNWEINIKDFIKNNTIDWSKALNNPNFRDLRAKALKCDFSRCMRYCPMHPANPHLNHFEQYGLRKEN